MAIGMAIMNIGELGDVRTHSSVGMSRTGTTRTNRTMANTRPAMTS